MPYSFSFSENDERKLHKYSHRRTGAPDLGPFVPTHMDIVELMLAMADVDEKDVLYDLGCGDGRIVIFAAREYGARGVGIDIDPQRIEEANATALRAGVEKMVEFRLDDVMKVDDLSRATVVTLYLLEESNALLRPLFDEHLKPGTAVVSHLYHIPGWEEKETFLASHLYEDGGEDVEHYVYLYRR